MQLDRPPPTPRKKKTSALIEQLIDILPITDKENIEYRQALESLYGHDWTDKDAPYYLIIHRVISDSNNYQLLSEINTIIETFNIMVNSSYDNNWLKSTIPDLLNELYSKLESIQYDKMTSRLYNTPDKLKKAITLLSNRLGELFAKAVQEIQTREKVSSLRNLKLNGGKKRTKSKRKRKKSKRKRTKSKRKRTKSTKRF